MIQKTYFFHAQIDGASDIGFHGALGMIAKQRMNMVVDHNFIGVKHLDKTLVDQI
jgi:hypothetical protein